MNSKKTADQNLPLDRQPFWLAMTEAQVALLKHRHHANLTHLPPVTPAETTSDPAAPTEILREEP